MLRLVANDFRLNAVWLFWIFLLLNLQLILFGSLNLHPHRFYALRVGFGFATAMPLVVLLREAYYRGRIVCHSIPLNDRQLVLARFLSLILLGIFTVLYGWLYQTLIESLVAHLSRTYSASQMEAGYAIEHSLIARALGLSIALGIVVPLVVRYGTVWRIIIGYIALRVIWPRVTDWLLDFSLHSTFFLGLSRWMIFASLIIITVLAISVRLSVWLYGRREL